MENFVKIAAGILVALVLYLLLNKQGKDFSTLVTLAVCCMVICTVMSYLKPVIVFMEKLEQLGKFDPEMMQIMFKAVGIGLLAEIVSLICADAGNSSMGKSLQILASVTILCLAIPLFTSLIEIIEEVLVAL